MEKCHFERLVDKIYLNTIHFGGYSTDTEYRYSVSEPNNERAYNLKRMSKVKIKELIKNYLIEQSTIGTWIDKETNTLYFDVSRSYPDLEGALTVARENNQLAIYDLKDNKAIYL